MKFNANKEVKKLLERLELARINTETGDIGIRFSINKGGIHKVRITEDMDVKRNVV